MKRFIICIILGAVIGCDTPRNIRYQEKNNASIVGISLKVKLLNAMSKEQTTVYFVKLEGKDENLLGTKIIPCNYYRGNFVTGYYAYLVNADPGKYAAVCSTKYEKQTYSTMASDIEYGYITFFDANILQNSLIDVGPNQIAFMGSFTVNSQLKNLYRNIEKNGDRAQQHYYTLLKPSLEGTIYCGVMTGTDRSKKATRQFLEKATDYFKNSEWMKMINTTIASLDAADAAEKESAKQEKTEKDQVK
jgi:hypothetical protein